MTIVLTVEEEYNMSPLEARFVSFYNKWNLKTSGDPLEAFRGLKNPKGVDLYYEIDAIDDWMAKRNQSPPPQRVDGWIGFIERWLERVERPEKPARKRALDQPFYKVMYNEIVARSQNRIDFPEEVRERFWRAWRWLTEEIPPRTSGPNQIPSKAMREWIDMVAMNFQDSKKTYYRRLISSVDAGRWDCPDMLDFLAVYSAGLLNEVLDIKYPKSFDRPNLDRANCDNSLRIDRGFYESN